METLYPLAEVFSANLRRGRAITFFFLLIIRGVRVCSFLEFQLYGDMAQRMLNPQWHCFANYSYFLFSAVLRLFWVYRVFYCFQIGFGYIIRLHFRRFKLAVSIRAPALTRNKDSVEGKQESVLEMVAKARRADGSHLIDAGWTPDIEAQGSTDQAAVGYENFRSLFRREFC